MHTQYKTGLRRVRAILGDLPEIIRELTRIEGDRPYLAISTELPETRTNSRVSSVERAYLRNNTHYLELMRRRVQAFTQVYESLDKRYAPLIGDVYLRGVKPNHMLEKDLFKLIDERFIAEVGILLGELPKEVLL